jgi:hypothetical protein
MVVSRWNPTLRGWTGDCLVPFMTSVGAPPGLAIQPHRPLSLEDERMPAASVGGEPSPTPKFSDFVALLNPLQNLPVVGTIYRQMTGDVPHPAARVIGGLIWGGPLGLIGAALTYVAEQVSGKGTTEIVKSIFDGGATAPPLAEAAPTPPVPAEPAGEPVAAATAPPMTAKAAASAMPAPALPDAQPPAMPAQQGAISQTRTRAPGTRDLAFYQAHAGARMPAASSAPAPSGPLAAPQLPALQRPATPVLGPEPRAAAAPPQPATAMMPETTSADFAQRMLQGLERYNAMTRAGAARAPVLDRAE